MTKDDKIQMLEDRVAELEDLFGTSATMCDGYLALGIGSGVRRQILGCLMKRDEMTREQIMTAVYGTRPDQDQPELRTIDSHVMWLRRALSPIGVEIETVWGQGFMITADNKARLKAWLAEFVARIRRGDVTAFDVIHNRPRQGRQPRA